MVSVLMAVYNETETVLRKSIESILNQTYSDFEFIIIGDNPENDGLNSIVNEYALLDKRVVFQINSENIGLTKSLNRGIKLSQGKYIARMDADDVAFPTRLEKQIAFMDCHPDVHVLNTSILKFFNDDYSNNIYISAPDDNDTIVERLLVSNLLFHPTIMIRKSFLDEFHITYNEMFRRSQDYAMWLDLASHGAVFASIKEPLLYYRSSGNQISIRYRDEQRRDAESILLYYIRRSLDNMVNNKKQFSFDILIQLYAKAIQEKDSVVFNKELLYKLLLSYDKIGNLFTLLLSNKIRCLHYPAKKLCKIILSSFIHRWDNEKIDIAKLL